LSSLAARKVALPEAVSILVESSWKGESGLRVSNILVLRQVDFAELRSRLCLAFRFFPRLVLSDSNWVRFGPHSAPVLMHLMHFSCVTSSHLRSGGLHCPPSEVGSWGGYNKDCCLKKATRRQNHWGLGVGLGGNGQRVREGTPHFSLGKTTLIAFFACSSIRGW
jgi:hypothetical protein